PLGIFRSRNLSGANGIQALMVAGMFGLFFLGALYLQRVLGFTSLEVGLGFLPLTAIIGILSLGFSAKLNMRFGPRATLLPGLGFIAAGLGLMTQISVDGSYWTEVLPSMVFMGIGAGLSFPSIMTLAMVGVRPEEAGLASGLVNTTLQVGGAIGLAVLATLSSNRTSTLLAGGDSNAEALTGGYQLAFVVGSGLLVAAIAIAALVLRPGTADAVPASEEAAEPVFSSEAA
ncbi:MAG TPA: MFS transporter, partial [Solirubrobacterales bacterium]|nr:MFS transporter [Solirubrobacterales bacterium]